MDKEEYKKLKSILKSDSKNILIFTHKNPDGDALGSSLALKFFLETFNHNVSVIVPNDYPQFLKWLPKQKEVLIYDRYENKIQEKVTEGVDLAFCLDFNSSTRIGNAAPILEKLKCPKVLIDHHQQPDDFDFMYSDVNMSSTSEMIYHFIAELDELNRLDKNMGTCIYTGILTDTGSFKFPNTTAVTHRVIAHLLELGVDKTQIHGKIEDSNSPSRLKLQGQALKNLRYLKEYRTAYITLSHDELIHNYYKKGDTEGFVNMGLSIQNYVLAVIFIEDREQGIVKMSLRSKGNFSVNEMARKHYQGGGHTNAAGGKSDLALEETVNQFLEILKEYKNELKHIKI